MALVEDMKGICLCGGAGAYVPDVFLIPNSYSSTGLLNIGLIISHALKFIYPTELGRFAIWVML
jgi:hypothetical protein